MGPQAVGQGRARTGERLAEGAGRLTSGAWDVSGGVSALRGARLNGVRVSGPKRERAARERGRTLVAGPETQRRKWAGAEEWADWA